MTVHFSPSGEVPGKRARVPLPCGIGDWGSCRSARHLAFRVWRERLRLRSVNDLDTLSRALSIGMICENMATKVKNSLETKMK